MEPHFEGAEQQPLVLTSEDSDQSPLVEEVHILVEAHGGGEERHIDHLRKLRMQHMLRLLSRHALKYY
jgi:hypothetical protein